MHMIICTSKLSSIMLMNMLYLHWIGLAEHNHMFQIFSHGDPKWYNQAVSTCNYYSYHYKLVKIEEHKKQFCMYIAIRYLATRKTTF